MSPRDPRLMVLMSRADAWERSVYYLDEPDEIDLEIIPPTSEIHAWVRPTRRVAERSARESAAQCKALAVLAEALIQALRRTCAEPTATG